MTTKTISKELRAFLQDWLDWAERGAPDGEPYTRGSGLCVNLARYTEHWTDSAYLAADRELAAAWGGSRTPFGSADYWARSLSQTQHECPKRLAWVRKTLAEAASEED